MGCQRARREAWNNVGVDSDWERPVSSAPPDAPSAAPSVGSNAAALRLPVKWEGRDWGRGRAEPTAAGAPAPTPYPPFANSRLPKQEEEEEEASRPREKARRKARGAKAARARAEAPRMAPVAATHGGGKESNEAAQDEADTAPGSEAADVDSEVASEEPWSPCMRVRGLRWADIDCSDEETMAAELPRFPDKGQASMEAKPRDSRRRRPKFPSRASPC